MAKLTVNHSTFRTTATQIESYIRQTKNNMQQIDQTVNGLGTSWQGADYQKVNSEWDAINGNHSTTDKMLDSLQNYADALKSAGEKYKAAQSRAINRAKLLCK